MRGEPSSDQERSSKRVPEENARLMALYRRQASGYDQSGIQGLDAFRREAISRLALQRGDLVVDLGCGTGLNFALLQEAIGKTGRIIGVDLTDAMLEQARLRVAAHGWKNVELVQADAAQYRFPTRVDGILSTFALTFVPDGARVIQSGCRALAPGRRWVVLDMAWPRALPMWLSPLLFFLRLSRYGIRGEVIRRRPWQTVWSTMQQSLVKVEQQPFSMGFFYLAWGTQPQPPA
jgi:demethylmenaquinone methyltransferase/2-methoxy-6-polyprenyl-1,4-benzoquinol methylase